jgi:hypothetical protein
VDFAETYQIVKTPNFFLAPIVLQSSACWLLACDKLGFLKHLQCRPGGFFSEKSAEKHFLAIGLDWDGVDSIDDYY